ncbi:hypothetical protein PENSPDRAFT_692427 [Peniophora sp. CONT]|nr:hypothetical protein PENSPDRAFT_692427 [Peniophora sp. CONT]
MPDKLKEERKAEQEFIIEYEELAEKNPLASQGCELSRLFVKAPEAHDRTDDYDLTHVKASCSGRAPAYCTAAYGRCSLCYPMPTHEL